MNPSTDHHEVVGTSEECVHFGQPFYPKHFQLKHVKLKMATSSKEKQGVNDINTHL